MKRPRFKLSAVSGGLRYTTADPHSRGFVADRTFRLVGRAAEQVVAGTGIDFEIRTTTSRGRTQWQPLRMTYDEAVEYLSGGRLAHGALGRCQAVRERREAAGKPTFARQEYDR